MCISRAFSGLMFLTGRLLEGDTYVTKILEMKDVSRECRKRIEEEVVPFQCSDGTQSHARACQVRTLPLNHSSSRLSESSSLAYRKAIKICCFAGPGGAGLLQSQCPGG